MAKHKPSSTVIPKGKMVKCSICHEPGHAVDSVCYWDGDFIRNENGHQISAPLCQKPECNEQFLERLRTFRARKK